MKNKKSLFITITSICLAACLATACGMAKENTIEAEAEIDVIEESEEKAQEDGDYTEEISLDRTDESPADLSPIEEPEDIEHLVIFDVECPEDFSDDIFVGLDKIWNYHFFFLTKEDNYHHEFTINKDELELYSFSFKSIDYSTLSWDVDDDPDNYEYHIKCSISRSDKNASDEKIKYNSEYLRIHNSNSEWYNLYTIIYEILEYPEDFTDDVYVEIAEDAGSQFFTSFWLSRENNYHTEIEYYGCYAFQIKAVYPTTHTYYRDDYRYRDDDFNIYMGFSLYEDMPEDYYEKNYG